jgi:hypothetical protein
MATWADVEREAPELAGRVKASFDGHKHKTMATLRRDGSPRISGTELDFVAGELMFGSMWGAVKARDLQRDPRVALHSATCDAEMVAGDAKVSGRAVEIVDDAEKDAYMAMHAERVGADEPAAGTQAEGEPGPEAEPYHLFRIELTEVAHTRIGDPPDHLVIERWREGAGTHRVERR